MTAIDEKLSAQLAQESWDRGFAFIQKIQKLANDRAISVTIPPSLRPAPGAQYEEMRTCEEAQSLYRMVALLGSHGILLDDLKRSTGSVVFQWGQKKLRSSGAVIETREPRKMRNGQIRDLVVLRLAGGGENDDEQTEETVTSQSESLEQSAQSMRPAPHVHETKQVGPKWRNWVRRTVLPVFTSAFQAMRSWLRRCKRRK